MPIPKYATEVPGLDDLLDGGLPRGRATLLAGRSGTGKTMMSLQIACNLARRGVRCVFATIEENPRDLLRAGDELGFDSSRLANEGDCLHIVDLVQVPSAPVLVSGDFDLSGLASRLVFEAHEQNAEIIILDSITALLSPVEKPRALRHLFFQLCVAALEDGRSFLVTAEADVDYGPITRLGMEDYVCDAVVILRNVVDGKRRRRSVEVHKYRRSKHLKGEYPCALTEEGFSVFPLDASSETEIKDVQRMERFSCGTKGLDEMTGGGWLRDSIVLVRGPTGSGKTILSGMYACAGAARDERVFYYGFEETESMLLRNYQALGLPVKKYVDEGKIRLIARFPEATSPEDMIIELRSVLDQHKPTLIVIDSISAIEHVTSYDSFRQFIVGITSALRHHGRSALLTQSAAIELSIDSQAPYLSTLADAILMLGYDIRKDGLERHAQVLKMRGSAHSSAARALTIGRGGLQVASDPHED
ncbi:ATPase domain-containing protein [Haliangium ochraceum]|uniref:non-specific serine/threonine protein kinase n=1 Tax=Haliangium ochraceum (strain DSM 14365 / JCM 11303 / SMP-2) TaxID=502025 RepID=D0LT56_HALO1|nr:ATPase domain-containing protein [Haliangium ochraceum]ACY19192.1 putative circadian clock protein, KaiC [Haliangium ochraceum DSM 14365]